MYHSLVVMQHDYKSEALEPDWLKAARAYPRFIAWSSYGRSISTLPVQNASPLQVTPSQIVRLPQQFAATHLYSWVERGTVRVKCLAQEHNTVSTARAQTRTAWSGDECTNHESTVPPTWLKSHLLINTSNINLNYTSDLQCSSDISEHRIRVLFACILRIRVCQYAHLHVYILVYARIYAIRCAYIHAYRRIPIVTAPVTFRFSR